MMEILFQLTTDLERIPFPFLWETGTSKVCQHTIYELVYILLVNILMLQIISSW